MTGRSERRVRLCRVATVPWLFRTLLREQLRCTVAQGIELTLVSSPGPELAEVAADVGATAVAIPMERAPSPLADLRSLHRLRQCFAQGRFDIVHSVSPKSGLLTAMAGALVRVPVRLHTFTGQPWVELQGMKRQIPRLCDRLTATLATQVYADSPSQRDFLIAEGLVRRGKISVVGPGSIAGVDLERFSRTAWDAEAVQKTRRELGLPEVATAIVFVGRVTRDKGIVELVSAFQEIAAGDPALHLVLVGPLEPERDPLPAAVLDLMKNHRRIRAIGFSATPEKYLAAADIFCLPSYREGFGTVAVEAAAFGLPTVVTKIVGLVDAVESGVTGLAVPPKDVAALAEALRALAAAPARRVTLGEAGRRRVERLFDSAVINRGVVAEYFRLMRGASGAGRLADQ
jgi:glycosyltransferase involved in cell wall biosynthesis